MPRIAERLFAWHDRDDTALVFLPRRGPPVERSGRELLRRASAVARHLRPAEYVLLACPPGPAFVEGLIGILLAGAVAVPVYPPRPGNRDRAHERLQGILAELAPTALLRTRAQADAFADLAGLPPALEVDRVDGALPTPPAPGGDDDVLLLQYTSGSTGAPRGVRLTERNLTENLRHLDALVPGDAPPVTCSWVPPYHDMGLIGGILHPLATGGRAVLLPPESVLASPRRWFEALAEHRATLTAAPPFALDRCIDRVPADPSLDLSALRALMVSTEPIPTATLEAFTRTFAPCGLDPRAVRAAYGLAEATLLVAAAPGDREARSHGGVLSCGVPIDEVLVVDDDGRPLPPGERGEIWLRGPCVGDGYQGRPGDPFDRLAEGHGGGWLRTGDVGRLLDGELYVHGRTKDVVTQRGRQHHAHDLEATVAASCPDVTERQVAVFAELAPGAAEQLTVLVELAEPTEGHAHAVRQALNDAHGLGDLDLAFVPTGTVRWTTSGKKARRVTRDAWSEQGRPRTATTSPSTEGEDTPNALYPRLAAHADPLDARSLAYRYDLERDLPWHDADAPGVHMTDELVAFAYAEFRPLLDDPDRRDRVQWALGIATAEVVAWLETSVVQFVERQHAALEGDRASLVALVEEEHKHIAMFRRYADHLRRQRPSDVPAFEASLAEAIARVPAPSLRGDQPAVWHFAAWVRLLIFEEWSVWIHARLKRQADVQPLWAALHHVHAREEIQHVRTDAAWLEGLELDASTRNHFVRGLPLDVMRRLQVVNHTVRTLCEGWWPGLRLPRPDPARPLVALLRDPAFRYTRAVAPELVRLVERGLPQEGGTSVVAYVPEPQEALAWLEDVVARRPRATPFDPDASFAALGLDSVDRLELAGALDDWLGGELPSTLTYELPTPRLLAEHLAALVPGPGTGEADGPLEAAPVTVRQARWLDVVPGGGRCHNVVGAWLAPVGTAPDDLLAALHAVAEAHPALQRRFERRSDGWWQVPGGTCDLALRPPADDLCRSLRHEAAACLDRPWDPGAAPLRARVLHDGHRCGMVWSAPHLLADGGAREVFLRSVDAALHGRLPAAPDPARLALRERAAAAAPTHEARLRWWRSQLAGLPATPAPAPTFQGRALHRRIEAARALRWLQGGDETPFAQLLAAFALAWQTTRGREAVVGTQLGERATAARRGMFGYLNDVVLVRPGLDGTHPAAEAAARTAQAWREGVQRRVPVDALVRELYPARWGQRWLPAPVSFNFLPAVAPTRVPDGWCRLAVEPTRRSFLFYEEMLVVAPQPDGALALTLWYDHGTVGTAAATATLEAFEARLDRARPTHRAAPPLPQARP